MNENHWREKPAGPSNRVTVGGGGGHGRSSRRCIHPEAVTVILTQKKAIWEAMKGFEMRSCWVRVGPKSKEKCP